MTASGSDDRSRGVVEALERHLRHASPPEDVLVLGDRDWGAAESLSASGARVVRWSRMVDVDDRVPADAGSDVDVSVSAWPSGEGWAGSWSGAALRLPRAKEELEMLVHAAASVLRPGGVLLVYGAKDEGIRSAPSRIEPVFGPVETVAVKSRCRVLRAVRPDEIPGLRRRLEDWRETGEIGLDGTVREWVSFPGLFAHGRVDPGTRLLLDAVSAPGAGSRVLDYGCGSGAIGAALLGREPGLELHLLDADALALEAARENVPGARTILAGGLEGIEDGEARYDLVVSNPPYHRGKEEDRGVVRALVGAAPSRLEPGGALVMVVQRRFPVEGMLRASFREVEILGEDGTYRVWRGCSPTRPNTARPPRPPGPG